MEFRNRTRERLYWYTEDDIDGILDPDHGIQPKLVSEFPVLFLEEDTPGPVTAVDTEIIDHNTIAAAADANSGVTNTTGLYNYSNAPTPIFTINPTHGA